MRDGRKKKSCSHHTFEVKFSDRMCTLSEEHSVAIVEQLPLGHGRSRDGSSASDSCVTQNRGDLVGGVVSVLGAGAAGARRHDAAEGHDRAAGSELSALPLSPDFLIRLDRTEIAFGLERAELITLL